MGVEGCEHWDPTSTPALSVKPVEHLTPDQQLAHTLREQTNGKQPMSRLQAFARSPIQRTILEECVNAEDGTTPIGGTRPRMSAGSKMKREGMIESVGEHNARRYRVTAIGRAVWAEFVRVYRGGE